MVGKEGNAGNPVGLPTFRSVHRSLSLSLSVSLKLKNTPTLLINYIIRILINPTQINPSQHRLTHALIYAECL